MSELATVFDQKAIRLSENLSKQGISKRPFSVNRRIQHLSPDLQKQIVSKISAQVEQMELLRPEIQEFEKLDVLCHFHGLKPVDSDIYTKLSGDTAWEIIDFGLNQVYRNKIIFKLGNYSIEEYETYSPWDLFLRPQSVLTKLMEITELLKTSESMINLEVIKPYIIEEALSEENAQFKITHGYACPLVDKITGEAKAFVSTLTIDPISNSNRVVLFK
jgi:hypothetical protein